MSEQTALLPCPCCGEPPEVGTLGTFVEIYCCVQMSRQKSEYLTLEERDTWNNEAALYGPDAERKVFDAVAAEWNGRRALQSQPAAPADTKQKILGLLAEITEAFDNAQDLSNADCVELSIEMAELAVTRLGDATEEATYDETPDVIRRSFEACDKLTQELEDIKEI